MKPDSKYIPGLFIFLFIICCSFFVKISPGNPRAFNQYFDKNLEELKTQVIILKKLSAQRKNLHLLQEGFLNARLAYKKLSILTDYFYPAETILLNGAPVKRVEEDNPDKIIPPRGFQVIENGLFDGPVNKACKIVETESLKILSVLTNLEKKPGNRNVFNEELVWDAVRSATIRLIASGITGYDSPVAMLSLQEAKATITGIKDLLSMFQKGKSEPFDIAMKLLDQATAYLQIHTNFYEFNRLDFITEFIDPFYKLLNEIRTASGINVPRGSYPVNFTATSIFAEDLFNIDFFSPGNNYTVTEERIELGKKLFSDTKLSGPKNRSCASCHKPELAFTDGLKTALSIDHLTNLSRNTPTLLNSGLQSKQFFDSRADILENQLDEVIHNRNEMEGSLRQSATDLKEDSIYNRLFHEAYPQEKEPVTGFNIANAISSYVRSLISLNARFDQYMRGDKTKLSEPEKSGFNLFMGKAKCATCHHLPLFNGLLPPEFIETESEVLGIPQTRDKINAKPDPDEGKFLFTGASIHKHSFKTPTIRNIELTAPYMHNGVYSSLEEVMEFYNNGGGKGLKIAPANQTLPFDKLNLTEKEIADIISFMKALTDNPYDNK